MKKESKRELLSQNEIKRFLKETREIMNEREVFKLPKKGIWKRYQMNFKVASRFIQLLFNDNQYLLETIDELKYNFEQEMEQTRKSDLEDWEEANSYVLEEKNKENKELKIKLEVAESYKKQMETFFSEIETLHKNLTNHLTKLTNNHMQDVVNILKQKDLLAAKVFQFRNNL